MEYKIVENLYGKQKVYRINPNEFGPFYAFAISSMNRKKAGLTREVQANEEFIKTG